MCSRMMLAMLPMEAMLVIGLVMALGALSCLKVLGAELEHEKKVHNLRVEAHQLRLERQRRLDEMQRQEQERVDRFTASRARVLNAQNGRGADELVGVDVLPEAA